MSGATFCSGIGAPEIACPEIDWRLASEIERFPRSVLMHRFGYEPAHRSSAAAGRYLWGDMTALRVRHMRRLGIPFPNVIVAGTPCQAYSVAGLRKSLDDVRGNLTLQFVRTVHAIRQASRARGYAGPVLRCLLWENVPGVLSTADNAFGCFLGGLVGADGAVVSGLDGGRWPRAGMVAGPFARAAWRILDAQYFGLAQRRKRVFVVVGFGDDIDPAAILFERRGLHGNSAPRRQTGQDVAGTLGARASAGGGLGTDFELGGGLHIAQCLNAGKQGRQDASSETLIPSAHGGFFDDAVTHPLRAEGFDASEDGAGRGIPLVPVAYDGQQITSQTNRHNPSPDDPCFTLNKRADASLIAFSSKDHGGDALDDLSPTLRAGNHNKSHANAGSPPAIAFNLRGREGGASAELTDVASVRAASGGSSRSYIGQGGVRRLTVRECARLQGFPDDHTLIPGYGGAVYQSDADRVAMAAYLGFASVADMLAFDPPADGPQYKAYGNSMAVPVLRWLLMRIVRALNGEALECAD